jgi:hypothetical protein
MNVSHTYLISESLSGPNGLPATVHFIRAGRNPLWTERDMVHLKKLELLASSAESKAKNKNRVRFHQMDHVGHWLHAEDLHGVLSLITQHSQRT